MKLDALRAKETSIVTSLLRIAPKRSLIAVAALSISLRRPRANSLDTKILKVHNSDRAKPFSDAASKKLVSRMTLCFRWCMMSAGAKVS